MVTTKKIVLSITPTRKNENNIFFRFSNLKFISSENFMKKLEKKLLRAHLFLKYELGLI